MRISDWSSDVCSSDLTYNGATNNNDGNTVDDNLLTLRLLPDASRGEVKFIAGGAYDRVRVEQTGLVGLLSSSYLIYGAEIQLPAPTAIPPANQTVCQGGTLTLTATPDRKRTRLNSSHSCASRMPSSA